MANADPDADAHEGALVSLLIKGASVVGGLGVIPFLIGVAYNFGYFYNNPNWFSYFDYKDHIFSLAPFIVPVLFLGGVLLYCRSRWRILDGVAAVIGVLTLALWWPDVDAITGNNQTAAAVVVSLKYFGSLLVASYALAVAAYLAYKVFVDPVPTTAAYCFLVLAGALGFFCLFGNASYHADVSHHTFETQIIDPQSKQPEQIHILRTIGAGIFFIRQSAPNQLVFADSDEVKSQTRVIGK